ncbi:MAG TPA: PIN domain-containing protein, partial [Terriglobales bacterium]
EKLPLDALLLAVAALPVSIVDAEVYEHSLDRARKLIGKRDPEDIEILALALHLRVALWSNDNDFEQTGVEWFTTAELLQRLGISGKR